MLHRPSAPSLIALVIAGVIGYIIGKSGDHSSLATADVQSGSAVATADVQSGSAVLRYRELPREAIFDELTAHETKAVAAYVVANMPNVRTSMYPDGMPDGDYITGTSAIELIPPPKAAALAYIDHETDERPPRYARVTISRGSKRDVMEYRVGPLHGCDLDACELSLVEMGSPMVPLVAEGSIPFEKRPMDVADVSPLALSALIFPPLKDLLLESFGPVFNEWLLPGCGVECFTGSAGQLFPFAFNDILSTSTERVSKVQLFWFVDPSQFQAMWLHPLPFSFRISQRGTDPADWKVFDLFYCGAGPFESAEALLAANPARCTYKPDPAVEGVKGAWDVPGPDERHARRPALARVEPPMPPRYVLDGAVGGGGRLVRWLGWSFFATMRPSTGLAAMDVRFNGRRIAYELALTEAAAHYSGTGADQVFYLDGAYSMSQLGGDMLPGVDCPSDASYLDGVLWLEQHTKGGDIDMDSDVARARPYKAFCIFEEASAASHWRHLQFATKAVDGVPSSTLVVRAVTAVGNYDVRCPEDTLPTSRRPPLAAHLSPPASPPLPCADTSRSMGVPRAARSM